mmetsp:Transcript_7637/g.13475  ORF Transcript_7637/g.13475 Transcript_7637/m.13475 type:complete len:217 (-) Transcript_7637:449-1099(-)
MMMSAATSTLHLIWMASIVIMMARTASSFGPTNQRLATSPRTGHKTTDLFYLPREEEVSSSPATLPTTSSPSRAVTREVTVTPIRSIKEYEALELEEKDELIVIRFHAPWCKVCQTTNISYERYATKLSKSHSPIAFYSIQLDGTIDADELKLYFLRSHGIDVRGVPMGILRHPKEGHFGTVKLHRKGLGSMKKMVESYLCGEVDLTFLFEGLEKL